MLLDDLFRCREAPGADGFDESFPQAALDSKTRSAMRGGSLFAAPSGICSTVRSGLCFA